MTANQAWPGRSLRDQVSEAEWQTRVELAAAYRLVAHFGWNDLIANHITARVPGTEHFLINAYGLMYEEMNASSLLKIDLEGNIILAAQDCPYGVNIPGYVVHSAVHAVRK